MIVFVQRDESGTVTGVYTHPQTGFAEEALPIDHDDVSEYLNSEREIAE